MTVSTTHLLSIGRFARTTGLSIRTLRRYDAIGLLVPAHVDEDTGYRWYTLDQARDGEAIRRLRELDVPLDEVKALLHAPPEALLEGLAAHRARLEGRAVELRRTLEELSRLIDGKEQLVPEQGDGQVRNRDPGRGRDEGPRDQGARPPGRDVRGRAEGHRRGARLRAGARARLPRPAALHLPVPGRRREAERRDRLAGPGGRPRPRPHRARDPAGDARPGDEARRPVHRVSRTRTA